MKAKALVTIWFLGVVSYIGDGAQVYAQTPYYQGKTIRLVQGREPGAPAIHA